MRGKKKRIDVQNFIFNLEDNIADLREELQEGSWQHGGYKIKRVCDPKPRIIHKASVRDRLLHHAIIRVIEPVFEKTFIYDTWSCRQGKGTLGSVWRCQSILEKLSKNGRNQVWVLKCDIKKYFNNIDNFILLDEIGKKIKDKKALGLLRNIIESFAPGIPLGNLTSQLFSNIYLNPFDHFVKEKLRPDFYIRYCDDFLIVSKSPEDLKEILKKVEKYLAFNLKLTLHPNKIKIRRFSWGIDWLGYVLYPGYRVLRPRTQRRMDKKIKKAVSDYLDGKMSRNILQSVFASYEGLLREAWSKEERVFFSKLYKCL